jgi:hypothetical protein
MRIEANRVGLLLLAIAVLDCGGSITGGGRMTGQGGQGGATTTVPCSAMGACECMAASDRCAARTEPCWCPSECNPQIECICGGGRFLGCEDQSIVASCNTALAAVQAKCADLPNVQYIADICATRADTACVAACLVNLKSSGACSEIDCGFCPVCDCAAPTVPSPFADCLGACPAPLPD